MARNHEYKTRSETLPRSQDDEVTELSLLMPSWQVRALEQAAHSEGISMGQYARRALQQALNQFVLPRRGINPCN